jgi:hypothetical protein
MATVTRPATSLPDPGDDLEAEPIRDYINNVLTFLEGNNIDDANVDFTSTDGIMALRKNQTVTGIKTHTGNIVLSGTATFDLNGIANALILDADADTHISAPTDDQIDIAIGGTDLITLATAGSTFSHPVTVGVDDTGYDVKFFGATTGKYMLWDESADTLAVVGTAITLNGTAVGDALLGSTGTWTADQTFNDNVNITLGTGGDADLYYDGTNVVLNPKVVGSGVFSVSGDIHANSSTATIEIGTPTTKTVSRPTLYLGTGGVERGGTLTNITSSETYLASNAYYDSGWKYVTTNVACFMGVAAGTMHFSTAASGTADTAVTFTERMTIDASGNVGIGNSSPDTNLHVYSGSAGSVTSSLGMELVVEGDGSAGIHILCPDASAGSIYWGSPTNAQNAQISSSYNAGGYYLAFATNTTERGRFDQAGNFYIGDTSNANITQGITINQGAGDGEILTLKSSDVAHGRVSMTETDTIFTVFKRSGTLGGVSSHFMAEDGAIDRVRNDHVSGGTANTAKTTAANGLTHIYMEETDGAGNVADITADGNIFAVACRSGGADLTRFLIDEDGDMYSATTGQTFDAHDDIALVNNYDVIRAGMAQWNVENEAELVRLGILGAPIAEGGLTNVTQLQRLHNGAIRQLGKQNNALQLELNEMKQQLFLLMERN